MSTIALDDIQDSADALLDGSKDLRERRVARRELLAEAASGALFLVAAGTLAAVRAAGHVAPAKMALLVGLYALFSHIRFPVGAGYVFPTQLILVPMLLLLPPSTVPLLVAAGLLLAASGTWARTRTQPERMLFAVSDAWHALGPAVVLTAATASGLRVTTAWVLVLAFLASCLVDIVSAVLREAAALGIAPQMQIVPAARAFIADACLAPLGLLAARSSAGGLLGVLFLLPLGALLLLIARDRDSHIQQAQRRLELVRRERGRLQSAVRRMGDAFAARLDLDALAQIMLRGSLEALDADGGRLLLGGSEHERPLEVVPAADLGLALEEAARAGRRIQVQVEGVWALAHPFEVDEATAAPGDKPGICLARRGREFQRDELALLAELAQRAQTAARDIATHQQIRQQALTDPLTGLANRRKLRADLEQLRTRGADGPPSLLVVFDLDGFKLYNDTFGHQAGDALLGRLGNKLASAAAEAGGHAYRLGGDEFCVLMRVDPKRLDHQLANAAAALSESGEQFSITASYGAVLLPHEAENADQALQRADERMYSHKRRLSSGARDQLSDVLVRAMRAKHPYLEDHAGEVAGLSRAVAKRLGMRGEQLDEVVRAAALHDVGKVGIPDALLDKSGPLSPDEWSFMHQHTILGERILSAAPALRPIARIVRSTHERWDGAGYPDELSGEQIPLGARIIAVCDAYDAMTSDRSYSPSMSRSEALHELREAAGTQFDPTVVAACVDELDADPPSRADADAELGAAWQISAHVRDLLDQHAG